MVWTLVGLTETVQMRTGTKTLYEMVQMACRRERHYTEHLRIPPYHPTPQHTLGSPLRLLVWARMALQDSQFGLGPPILAVWAQIATQDSRFGLG